MNKNMRFLAVLSTFSVSLFTMTSYATAATTTGPAPLTYNVTVNSFANDRLYTSSTTQDDSTLAAVGEPQIASDANGNLFVGSEYGVGSGTGYWKSGDGGLTYQYGGVVNSLVNGAPATAGGGDVSLAVAPSQNATGQYNMYAASLSLANITLSTSTDGGNTFTNNAVSSTVPVDDREWIAASGANTVYLSYHDIATDNIDVERSDNAGQSWTILGEAINPLSNVNVVGATNDNELGNIAVTPDDRYLYQIFVAGVGYQENTQGTPKRGVYMAVSQDGGQTFTDYNVNIAPVGTDYGHQFPQVTLDKAGNVYALYTDNHNLFMSVSKDHGQTWSAPVQVNKGGAIPSPTAPYRNMSAWVANPNSTQTADQLPEAYSVNATPDSYYNQELIPAYSNVAIEPWAVAGDAGKIDIVWYGTNQTTGADGQYATDTTDDHVHWSVFMAQSTNALSSSPTFVQAPISPVVHRAGVSESGVSSVANGEDNRDLFDDFGITVNPNTGNADVIYTSDQLDPTDSSYYSKENNSNHTAYAHQTSNGQFAPIVSPATK